MRLNDCREHEHTRPVQVDELAGRDRIGRVGHHRDEAGAEFGLQLREPVMVPGEAGYGCACLGQGDGNAAAETPARAGHECGRAG